MPSSSKPTTPDHFRPELPQANRMLGHALAHVDPPHARFGRRMASAILRGDNEHAQRVCDIVGDTAAAHAAGLPLASRREAFAALHPVEREAAYVLLCRAGVPLAEIEVPTVHPERGLPAGLAQPGPLPLRLPLSHPRRHRGR